MQTVFPATELETAGIPSEGLAAWLCQHLLHLLSRGFAELHAGRATASNMDHENNTLSVSRAHGLGHDADVQRNAVMQHFFALRQAVLHALPATPNMGKRLELLQALSTGDTAAIMVGIFRDDFAACVCMRIAYFV
jgi:hypothetical protein